MNVLQLPTSVKVLLLSSCVSRVVHYAFDRSPPTLALEATDGYWRRDCPVLASPLSPHLRAPVLRQQRSDGSASP
eukprot:11675248-Prorocentrum_lima.AAC.1